jgi:hypothetical protein
MCNTKIQIWLSFWQNIFKIFMKKNWVQLNFLVFWRSLLCWILEGSADQYLDYDQHSFKFELATPWNILSINISVFTKEIIIFLLSRRLILGTALVCLHNLRKTFKYGGRKMAPSIEEITAISAGRNSKRQIYRLPGHPTPLFILYCFLTNK